MTKQQETGIVKSFFRFAGVALTVLLAAQSARAVMYDWVGPSAGTWDTNANWNPGTGFPGAGDGATFSVTSGVPITLGIAQSANSLAFSNTAGSYVISGASLTLGTGGLSHAATVMNEIAAQILGTGPATWSVSAGTLKLSNTTNSIPANVGINVSGTGNLSVVASGAASGIGSAGVTLAGGTLSLVPGATTTINGISEKIFNRVVADAQNDIESYRSATVQSDDGRGTLTTHLNYPNDASVTARAVSLGAVGFDEGDFSMLWVGDFKPNATGAWGFRFNNLDDNASIWVDYDGNGVFSTSGGSGNERVYARGCCTGSGDQYTASLTGGTTYKFGIAMSDTGGGGNLTNMEVQPPSGSWTALNPSTPALNGIFTVQGFPSAALSNAVAVTASSTIQLGTTLPSATLGTLAMGANTQLTVNSADGLQPLTFTGATTLSGGTATFNTTGRAVLTLNSVGESAATNLTKTGDGTLVLPTANSYTGQTNVNQGVLEIRSNDALGTAAGGTVVANGASLRMVGGFDYSTLEALTLTGDGNAASNGALNNASGDNNYRGPITLNGNATIRSSANTLRLYGVLDNAGSQLTFRSEGNTEVYGRVTGAGAVRKEGGGTLVFMGGAGNNYTGSTSIAAGVLDARDSNALGTAAGSTDVNGGTLLVRDGITLADNISINGLGWGNQGAIRSENNVNTLTGLVTVNGTSRIHVNTTSLQVNGRVTGGTIDKTGAGTLILTNATNNFAAVQLNEGALRISNPGALGQTPTLTIDPGEALEFDGTMALTSSALTSLSLKGGTLTGVSGTTTVNVPLSLGTLSNVNFGGAGNLVVTSSFGNGNAPISANMLNHYGYRRDTNDALFDLNNNGGMLNAGSPTTHPTYTGQALLQGPLSFPNEASFLASGVINFSIPGYNDNYTNLWVGYLNTTQTGNWQFQRTRQDDWTGMWVDLDQDGVLESSVAGLGSDRGEQLAYNDGNVKTVNLTNPLGTGRYLVAFTHLEGNGDANAEFQFKSPSMGGLTIINPGDAGQAGLWNAFQAVTPTNNVVKNDTGVVTLAGNNTFNGTTTVNAGTLIAASSTALGTADGGTKVISGATLALQGGITIAGEALTLDGPGAAGQLGVLTSLSGTNRTTGAITAQDSSAGQVAVGAAGGSSLTLDGPVNLRFSKLVLNGAGNVLINGAIGGLGVSAISNGIDEKIFNRVVADAQGDIQSYRTAILGTDDAHGILTTHLNYPNDASVSTRAAALGAIGFDNENFSAVWVTDFKPNATGQWGFRFDVVDDNASFWVDTDQNGTFEAGNRFYNRGCCGNSGDQFTASLTAGQTYKFGIAMSDTGGGGWLNNMQVKSPTGSWTALNPSDPALNGVFTVAMVADNSLVKNGTGTTTLAGNNTYNGPTMVNQGTLIAAHNNALGATSAGTIVADDATLAFQGGVNVGAEPLTVGRFTAPGKEGIANLSGVNSFAGNITTTAGAGDNVGIRSDAGRLTLTGTVALGQANLTVAGDGNTVIANAISGGSTVQVSNYANAILSTSGLRAYYRFGEAVGATTAIDTGPNGYNGTYEGGAGSNLGAASAYVPLNNALNLDGADDRVALTTASNLGIQNSSFTAMAWVNADTLGGDKTIFGTDQTGTNVGLHLIVRGTQPWMGFFANDTGGVQALSPGMWYLMTWRYDISNGQQAIFINGALDNATTGHGAFQGNDTIRVGRWGGSSYFDGRIDEPAFFNRALSNAEILNLYNQGPLTTTQTVYSNLVKKGLGTLTLGGNNTYNGTTTVNGGTLLVNGTTSGQGSYTVQSGATLGGTGIIGLATGAKMEFEAGSFLSPGLGPGTLTINGDMIMDNGSTYIWELGANAYDVTAVTGALTLHDWTLRIMDAGGVAHPEDIYYIFLAGGLTSLGNVTVDWSGVPLWLQNSEDFFVGFDGTGVYITGLQSLPEPTTLTLLALGGLGLWRRRRAARQK